MSLLLLFAGAGAGGGGGVVTHRASLLTDAVGTDPFTAHGDQVTGGSVVSEALYGAAQSLDAEVRGGQRIDHQVREG